MVFGVPHPGGSAAYGKARRQGHRGARGSRRGDGGPACQCWKAARSSGSLMGRGGTALVVHGKATARRHDSIGGHPDGLNLTQRSW